jgi:hypothetical protein
MMSLQSLLQSVQAIELKEDVNLSLVLETADDQSRALVEAGSALMKQQGLEYAAEFISSNMYRLLLTTRAKAFQVAPETELDLAA